MNRIYVFTGKGGVGKTSLAAAHAKASEMSGKKTLLVSTDMAHNLGDIFEVECKKEKVAISPNLDLLELDPEYIMNQDYEEMVNAINKLIFQGVDHTMEEFGMIPGMEELFSLMKIADIYQEKNYENIIVDCAPTGETLSLLKFPELLSWYMEKFFPIGKVAVRVLSPFTKMFMKIDLPNRNAMNDIEKLYLKLYDLQQLLKNPEITSIRLVTLPEKMVVEETKRNYMNLNLFNFHVDAIFINRVLPPEINNPFFDQWKEIQAKYITEIEDSFSHLSMTRIPWFDEEVKGIEAIEKIASKYLGKEVFKAYPCEQKERFENAENGYTLTIFIPGAVKEMLDVYKVDNTVVIKLENYKRNILLPDSMKNHEIVKAKFENENLILYFENENL